MHNEHLKQLTLLYAEDDASIREELVHFLTPRVGTLLVAQNGQEAWELFTAHRPDLVVSDIMMPVKDGLKLASEIKEKNRSVPVIFTTAFNDTQYLHQAINLGIDGYVLKPIDLEKLSEALVKGAEPLLQSRQLAANKAMLEAYHEAAEEERYLVAELMGRMMRPENLKDPHLHYWLQPTEVVSGDLVATYRARNDRFYLMLADSTGHGLPAALNLLPINHIFYSMAGKGLPISLIVEEMNWAVKEQSPADRYVAALLAAIDPHNRVIEIWNGGIPPALLIGRKGEVIHTFKSVNLPLGILDRTLAARTEIYQWQEEGGQFMVYSDGLAEAENEQGESFGAERLVATLRGAPPAERLEAVQTAVRGHLGSRHAFDDMTLLLLDCNA
ncbi:MAG: PP2C family protein-serine/threonine phosphatase [Sulfuricellaceae bacterium]|jgi:serine phosphatase RsbU (regulator of sigma subunit)